jgi:hypothetical protein
MFFSVLAVVLDLDKERAVIAPHIVEHVRDEITRNGYERNEMAFAGWLARLDGFIHQGCSVLKKPCNFMSFWVLREPEESRRNRNGILGREAAQGDNN